MTASEPETLYVCAGICRVDYRTSTCIGCGRPVIETTPPAAPLPDGENPQSRPAADSDSAQR